MGEHRRGCGGLYDALSAGWVDVARLRRAVATVLLPRAADGRLVLAADLTCWLRPSAHTSQAADRVPHLRARQGPAHPRSRLALLCDLRAGDGRSSWTAPLDALRLEPGDDAATAR
ncbi:transposase (plasmid) [Streptomyces globisporus]|uniref:transposase n=1 Tax=Streptomyces globisporus TaxID=1908 RepID=UPI003866C002|nr:transposase [Streptomyces globisporus]WSU86522.1 transposase [Streptomyces globisporus]